MAFLFYFLSLRIESKKNHEELGLTERIKLIEGDALETIEIVNDNKYDLIFIDAAKAQYMASPARSAHLFHGGPRASLRHVHDVAVSSFVPVPAKHLHRPVWPVPCGPQVAPPSHKIPAPSHTRSLPACPPAAGDYLKCCFRSVHICKLST